MAEGKLLFVHDGPLFFDAQGNYYEFAYHELFQRYSYIANKITFMMRTYPIEGVKKYTIVPKQIKVISIPNFKSPKTYLKNKKKAERIIEGTIKKNDYIVLRSQSSIAQIAMKYVKKYKKPYIVESVGCSWDSYWNHGILGKIVAPYMFLKTRSIIWEAPYVHYVTEKFLQRRYPTKGKSLGCSNVVLESLKSEILNNRLEKINTFNPMRKLILGTAAALDTPYKGQEYVIMGIRRLLEKGYAVEYHLAGGKVGRKPNNFLQDLARKYEVEDKVVFVGSLSMDQMADYYDSLDIYVQPSKQEGLPRSVIEAMSRGCPVIGTDIAGIPELIQKDCLFKKGSTETFLEALNRILNKDLRKIAEENFNMAKKFERIKLQEKREMFYNEFLIDLKRMQE